MKKLSLLAGALLGTLTYGHAQTVYSQDFEATTGTALPTGWSQVNAGTGTGVGWLSGTNTSTGSSNFTLPAHTRFITVNDDANQNAANTNDFVMSDVFSLSGVTGTPYLNWDEAFLGGTYNGASESLTTEISTDGGTTWTVLQNMAGNQVSVWETKHIDLTPYLGMSNLKLGWRYKDGGDWLFGVGIDNVVVNVPPTADLQLEAISPATGTPGTYVQAGSGATISGTVSNQSSVTVTSYTVTYQQGTNAPVSQTFSANIAPFASGNFTISTPVPVAAVNTNYPVNVWVSLSGDANATNDSANTSFTGVGFTPNKKIVFEEGTGTWCGFCVRGIVYMDSLRDAHGANTSLIAVHDHIGSGRTDPMAIDVYDNFYSALPLSGGGGYPSVAVDRRTIIDPDAVFDSYDNDHNMFGYADIALSGMSVSNGTVGLTATVRPAIDLSGDYRLAMVLTEDNVVGTNSDYDQHNYYNNAFQTQNQLQLGNMANAEYNFNTLPYDISYTTIKYNFVARSISTAPGGTPNSLPATMTAGTDYSYTFSAPLTSTWNTDNMHAVVMLIRNSDGVILNSNNITFPLGIQNVAASINNMSVFPNPAHGAATLHLELKDATDVAVTVTDMTGREVYTNAVGHTAAGELNVAIPTATLANGMYNVTVKTTTGTASQRLSVVK